MERRDEAEDFIIRSAPTFTCKLNYYVIFLVLLQLVAITGKNGGRTMGYQVSTRCIYVLSAYANGLQWTGVY